MTDTELRGFFLKVGVNKKTFMVRGEFWQDGKRATKKVALGYTEELSTREAHVLAKAELAKIAKGGYITRSKLSDHLRASQQALSDFMIAAGTTARKDGSERARAWPLLPSRRIGDDGLDPTPADPRVGQPWSEENRRVRIAAKLARAA